MRRACGFFDKDRYSEYCSKIDELMRRRASRGYSMGDLWLGYASDVEREEEDERAREMERKKLVPEEESIEKLRNDMKARPGTCIHWFRIACVLGWL